MNENIEKMIKYLFTMQLTREYTNQLGPNEFATKMGYSKYVRDQCIRLKISYEEISNIE